MIKSFYIIKQENEYRSKLWKNYHTKEEIKSG